MAREILTDELWTQLRITLKAKGCREFKNGRKVMEAMLWKLRTGAPWCDIPGELCPWKTAYNRFNRWAEKGLWENFFLAYEAKLIRNGLSPTEVTCALTSIQVELGVVKMWQLASPEVVQQLRYTWPPMRMETRSILKSLGGEVHDAKAAKLMMDKIGEAEHFIADKGYDSEDIRTYAREKEMTPVIPRKSNSKKANPEFDPYLYRLRHLVENLFARLKHFRSIATRFEKLARNYKAMLFAACSFIWLKVRSGGKRLSSKTIPSANRAAKTLRAASVCLH